MKTKTPEAVVLKACLQLLKLRGVTAWRNNTGAHKIGKRFIRYGKVGSSDIMAVWPTNGRALYFEIKRPGGKATEKQKDFLADMNRLGAFGVVVDDVTFLSRVLDMLEANPNLKAEDIGS